MKKKSFIPIVVTLLVVTIISFVYSCKDEPLDFTHSKVENQKSAKLETAKQWFRQNESGITFSKSGESIGPDGAYFPSFSGEPSWKYYAVTENENLEVIDVDLTDRINQDFILKNSFKNYKKNHQLKLRRSYTRYVHVKNKKTGKEQGFFMTIVPSPYYARTYSHRMKINKYLKRDKYLGGYVLFHNFEGKFVNGWEYKKGKIVGRVLPNGVSTHPDKRKFSLVKLKAKYIVKPQLYTPIKTKSGDESFYDGSWNDNYDNTTVELDLLEFEGTRNDDWAKDEDLDEDVNLEEEPYERCPFGGCDDDPCPYNDCYDDFGGIGNDDISNDLSPVDYKYDDEPIKPYAGTASMFKSLLDNSPNKVGKYKGEKAKNYLKKLGDTKFNWSKLRPEPTQASYFNRKESRYIYTKKGGWIDMAHFMFYAGRAYNYMLNGKSNPIGEAVQDGYHQELSDRLSAPHSAYSYEDLPSDKFGAEFGVNHFNPNSNLTFGEQIENYLNDVLDATDPENAPNYNSLPDHDSKSPPSRTNKTTTPIYVSSYD